MAEIFDETTKQVLGLGLISGTRSTLATALAAHYLQKQPNQQLAQSKLKFIQSPLVAVVSKLLAAGEMAADKFPGIPDRIIAPALLARVASGALAGAIISTANKESVARGIAVGAIAAFASTYLMYFLRRKVSSSNYIKEPWAGIAEDVVAVVSGVMLLR